MNYIQENIEQIQHAIMDLEDGKESAAGMVAIQNVFENIKTVDEAKFLLEKLCSITINQTCEAALITARLIERDALLQEVQQDSNIQQQLLHHVLAQSPATSFNDTQAQASLMNSNNLSTSTSSIGSGNTVIVPFENSILSQTEHMRDFSINPIQSSGSSRSPSPTSSICTNDK